MIKKYLMVKINPYPIIIFLGKKEYKAKHIVEIFAVSKYEVLKKEIWDSMLYNYY